MKLCDCKVLSVLPGPFTIPGNYRLEVIDARPLQSFVSVAWARFFAKNSEGYEMEESAF